MANNIQTVVILGDDIYADITTAFLSSQFQQGSVSIIRLIKGVQLENSTINADHSVHVFHQEIGLRFEDLYRQHILTPVLVSAQTIAESMVYLESYPYLKDDLPLPQHQLMCRLIREGIADSYESISPLVALHKEKKFYPQLHRLYRGEIRPYGAMMNVRPYSLLLRQLAVSKGVKFIEYKNIEVKPALENRLRLAIDSCELKDIFLIDMSDEQLIENCFGSIKNEKVNAKFEKQFWFWNSLTLSNLKQIAVSPVSYFEWLYKSLVRFIDFFPDWSRLEYLALEYNRLQMKECNQIKEFVMMLTLLRSKDDLASLSDATRHSVDLFKHTCQLSREGVNLAYANYWAPILIASGIHPQKLPRRVEELPLHILRDWFYQRQKNIEEILRRAK